MAKKRSDRMAKNLIPEIVKMLGVGIGEEFKIEGNNRIYKFDLNGLHSEHCEMEAVALWAIVCGDMEIVKMPWKPKKGDVYYTFELLWGKWVVRSLWWAGVPCNYALLDKGWVFRTKEETKAALPKVAAEMGVEYEL